MDMTRERRIPTGKNGMPGPDRGEAKSSLSTDGATPPGERPLPSWVLSWIWAIAVVFAAVALYFVPH